jgi:hypothetical protein
MCALLLLPGVNPIAVKYIIIIINIIISGLEPSAGYGLLVHEVS